METSALLTLVRHGETSANLDGVWHGSTDTALTLRGRKQAERVARYLGESLRSASAIYSSPLQRAHDTALAIGRELSLEPVLNSGLREFDLGQWEGRSYASLYREVRLWDHMRQDPHFAPHGGESPRAVTDRFVSALSEIAGRHANEHVIVVAHGGAFSLALAEILDGDYRKWDRAMGNCAVSDLQLHPEPQLIRFNYLEHLDGV